ncbi:hypothetical protein FHX09_003650 [Rhizobium sp. BK538]|nr:hypothetical protein [Rhizobium sp. BK538]
MREVPQRQVSMLQVCTARSGDAYVFVVFEEARPRPLGAGSIDPDPFRTAADGEPLEIPMPGVAR